MFPFPPAPGSYIVFANDGKGTAVEITPSGTVLVPGEGVPDENDLSAATEEFEGQFVQSELKPRYVATHLNISTQKSIEEIRELAKAEGWRVLVCNRDRGLFQLIEVWIENTFMLEVMTPEQTQRYIQITDPIYKAAIGDLMSPTQRPAKGPPRPLNLIAESLSPEAHQAPERKMGLLPDSLWASGE